MAPVEQELAEQLAQQLECAPTVDGAEITGWRFDLGIGWSLQAGLRQGRLGGPYEPPSAAHGSGGSIYLLWSDGSCSHGRVDGATSRDFELQLEEWRANALLELDRPELLEPAPLPGVQTASAAVEAVVEGDPAPLIATVGQAYQRLVGQGLEKVDLDAGASRSWRFVFSSNGMRVAYRETSAGFSISAEELYSRGFQKRRLMNDAELGEMLDDVVLTTRVLRETVEPPAGEVPVLLTPQLAMRLVGTFIVGNLSGSAVSTGRSPFTLDDFANGRRILRDDLAVAIDTLLDLEGAASPVSSEGVPGGRAMLIERGRLIRPVVDLKYANRTGFAPTPTPRGAPGFLLQSARPSRELSVVRAEISKGIQAHSVLGLHTQDATSGRFSLVVPNALVLRDGSPVGRAKVALSAHLLELLSEPRTELVRFPWSLNPGLLLWPRVESRA